MDLKNARVRKSLPCPHYAPLGSFNAAASRFAGTGSVAKAVSSYAGMERSNSSPSIGDICRRSAWRRRRAMEVIWGAATYARKKLAQPVIRTAV
jgi:hypothetical protein